MFEKKTLIIVYDEKTKMFAEYLVQLISLNDDQDDVIIGCKDGSISAAIWTEKQYNDNLPTMSSEQFVLFIGTFKSANNIIANITQRYSKHGVKYGWLGNKCAIYLDKKHKFTEETYEAFLEDSQDESKKMLVSLLEKKSTLAGAYAAVLLVGAIPTITIGALVISHKEKVAIRNQLYKFAISEFYLNGLQSFIEG